MYQEENGVWGGALAGRVWGKAPAGCGPEPRRECFAILDPHFHCKLYSLNDRTISATVRSLNPACTLHHTQYQGPGS